jgi:hypothetical protein
MDAGLVLLCLCLVTLTIWFIVWSRVVGPILDWIFERIGQAMIRRARAPRDRSKPPRIPEN